MKKKIIAGTMIALMTTALSLPVCAADTQTKTTDITAAVESTYILTIPEATTIPFGALTKELDGVLKVIGNVTSNESVEVAATTTPLAKVGDANTTLSYTLRDETSAFTAATWTEEDLRKGLVNADDAKTKTLTVVMEQTTWQNAKAGEYQGGITFTATLKQNP